MATSAEGNRPRWRGGPRFFEIWFAVVFDPRAPRAWWLRYTTFAPAPGRPEAPRATVWAAAFDARAAAPVTAAKRILPAATYEASADGPFRVRLGDAEITNGRLRGAVEAGGHRLAWDLTFAPAARAASRAPALLERLPLPTRVAHANDGVHADGWVETDGRRVGLEDAPAVQKHLWGTRRVEELSWLYCARFDGDPDARLEGTAVRIRQAGGPPALVTLWATTAADGIVDRCGALAVPRNRCERVGPTALCWRAAGARHRLVAAAACDPATLAGWVYRDPGGRDLYVAQSDVASCTLSVETRRGPLAAWRAARRLECVEGAALEFHSPAPLPGVPYVAWDEEALPSAWRRSS